VPPTTAREFSRSSGNRLTSHDVARFPGESLFDRLGRSVCRAGCLPRKELFEAWEMARRVRRRFRGGRVVDLAGGHGLLAQALLVLDATSPSAVVRDSALPPSASILHEVLAADWPRLRGAVAFEEGAIAGVHLAPGDVVVSCHACGALSDQVLEMAAAARARVAVLPCCHDVETCDAGALGGWMDTALAIDVMRVNRLEAHGYKVWTATIPADITPKHRLILAEPVAVDAL
jgi:hypothetical protein